MLRDTSMFPCGADVYTSRVSNFLRYTPFSYFRSPTQTLAHDRPTGQSPFPGGTVPITASSTEASEARAPEACVPGTHAPAAQAPEAHTPEALASEARVPEKNALEGQALEAATNGALLATGEHTAP